MANGVKNGDTRAASFSMDSFKQTTVSALGGVVEVVADTTSTTLKAGEKVSDDITSLTRKMVVNTIRGVADVTAALGSAALDNARGGVQGAGLLGGDAGSVAKEAAVAAIHGAGEVGTELGEVAKKAAIGFIHGSAEVGSELGKVCKEGAIGLVRGAGEVTAELGAVAKANAKGLIEGGTETTTSFEDGLLTAARKLLKGYHLLRREHLASLQQAAAEASPASQKSE